MSEMERLETRLRALGADPGGDADWDDVLHRAGNGFGARQIPQRRLVLAVAVTVALAAIVGGAITLGVTRPAKTGSPGVGPTGRIGQTGGGGLTGRTGVTGVAGPFGESTLAHPLPWGQKVSLSDAARMLGGAIVLPDTPDVTPSDVGAVWADRAPAVGPTAGANGAAAAVVFPSQGLMIRYVRPPVPDPLANYRGFASQSPGAKVVYLRGGLPALAIAQLPDGSNWGSVEFVAGGTTIVVMGHSSEADLEAVAQSIADRVGG